MKYPMVLAIMAIAGMGTAANAQSYDADRQLEYFTVDALKATLAELGATTTDREGVPNVSVQFSNKMMADAVPMACEDQDTAKNCRGTSILATFSKPSDGTDEDVLGAINEYNYRQNFGRAYMSPDGKITLRMYIISDGGITMENYRQQIGLFERSGARFSEYLYE